MTDTERTKSRGSDRPSPEFRVVITAAESDVDEQGHVSNIAYIRWIQEAAVAHSSAVGLTPEAYRAKGAAFVVRKHEVEYLRPALAGDRIALITQVSWWRGAQSERATHIVRAADDQLLARASTRWVYVSVDNGRPRRIPGELEHAFYGTL